MDINSREPLPLLRRNGQFQTPSLRVGILVQANTTLWFNGIMFALAVTKNMIQTNTGALEPSNPYMVTKVPSVPGILMSKFTRCSHPFLLIHINSFTSQRKRRLPQPSSLASRMFFQHLAASLTLPYLSAAQSWFIALFAFPAVPLLPSLSQSLILPQSHPRL